jgi:hypothetical protein
MLKGWVRQIPDSAFDRIIQSTESRFRIVAPLLERLESPAEIFPPFFLPLQKSDQ